MSRIHDALRRAEQERAALQEGHAAPAAGGEIAAAELAQAAPVAEPTPHAVASARPTSATIFDTLLARCRQRFLGVWRREPV
jgi:hypothetical protein